MSDVQRKTLEEIASSLYRPAIAEFARGLEALEQQAIHSSIPSVAALTLPEEYAVLALTARMDNELRKLLRGALHRQGDAEDLLFGYDRPFGSFSNTTRAAYAFGFVTKKMFEALNAARKVRNSYAHSDNPDQARNTKEYREGAARLRNLDQSYFDSCLDRFKRLRQAAVAEVAVTPQLSEIVGVMVQMCDNLSTAAQIATIHKDKSGRVAAFYGFGDYEV